jgi:hypothetical protein
MKTKSIPTALAIGLASLLVGCGQTSGSTTTATGTTVAAAAVTTVTATSTSTSTSTTTNAQTSLLVYSISQTGNQVYQSGNLTSTLGSCGSTCNGSYTTAAISTDSVLKVKFKVGSYQGNNVGQADLLKVSISVNGTTIVPTYETSNYTYGEVGELSNTVDFSAYLSAGVSPTIVVSQPMNDWYCVTWDMGINSLYNNYPSCYKSVYQTHTWSGTIYVQTDNTVDISTAQ